MGSYESTTIFDSSVAELSHFKTFVRENQLETVRVFKKMYGGVRCQCSDRSTCLVCFGSRIENPYQKAQSSYTVTQLRIGDAQGRFLLHYRRTLAPGDLVEKGGMLFVVTDVSSCKYYDCWEVFVWKLREGDRRLELLNQDLDTELIEETHQQKGE
jgi:hypothetical protein